MFYQGTLWETAPPYPNIETSTHKNFRPRREAKNNVNTRLTYLTKCLLNKWANYFGLSLSVRQEFDEMRITHFLPNRC